MIEVTVSQARDQPVTTKKLERLRGVDLRFHECMVVLYYHSGEL